VGIVLIILGGGYLMPAHMWGGGTLILLGMGIIVLSNHVPNQMASLMAVFKSRKVIN
jgi:hypothetical protein